MEVPLYINIQRRKYSFVLIINKNGICEWLFRNNNRLIFITVYYDHEYLISAYVILQSESNIMIAQTRYIMF